MSKNRIRMLLFYIYSIFAIMIIPLEESKIGKNVQIRSRNNAKKSLGFVKKDHIGIVNRTNLEDNITIHIKNKEKSLYPQFAIFVDDFMVCSKAKNHVDLCTGSSDDFYFWEIFYVDKNGYMIVIRRNGNLCLTYNEKNNTDLYLKKCSLKNKYQFWDINKVERDSGFNLPEKKRAIEQPIASNLVNLLYKNLKSALNSLT